MPDKKTVAFHKELQLFLFDFPIVTTTKNKTIRGTTKEIVGEGTTALKVKVKVDF
jgi:hypothetical protein